MTKTSKLTGAVDANYRLASTVSYTNLSGGGVRFSSSHIASLTDVTRIAEGLGFVVTAPTTSCRVARLPKKAETLTAYNRDGRAVRVCIPTKD